MLIYLAPGDYAPEKSTRILDCTPQYTFGMRTQIEKPLDTPGSYPSRYTSSCYS